MAFGKLFKISVLFVGLLLVCNGTSFAIVAMQKCKSAINDYYAVQGIGTSNLGKRFDCISRLIVHLNDGGNTYDKEAVSIFKDLSLRINNLYPHRGPAFGPQVCYGFALLARNGWQPIFAAGKESAAIWLDSGQIDYDENGFQGLVVERPLPDLIHQWAITAAGDGGSPHPSIPALDMVVKIGDASDLANAFAQIQTSAKQRTTLPPDAPFYVRIESQNQKGNYFVFIDKTPYAVVPIPLKSFLDDKGKQSLLPPVSALYGPPPPPKPPHYYYVYSQDDDEKKRKALQSRNMNVETCNPDDPECEQWRNYNIECGCFTN